MTTNQTNTAQEKNEILAFADANSAPINPIKTEGSLKFEKYFMTSELQCFFLDFGNYLKALEMLMDNDCQGNTEKEDLQDSYSFKFKLTYSDHMSWAMVDDIMKERFPIVYDSIERVELGKDEYLIRFKTRELRAAGIDVNEGGMQWHDRRIDGYRSCSD